MAQFFKAFDDLDLLRTLVLDGYLIFSGEDRRACFSFYRIHQYFFGQTNFIGKYKSFGHFPYPRYKCPKCTKFVLEKDFEPSGNLRQTDSEILYGNKFLDINACCSLFLLDLPSFDLCQKSPIDFCAPRNKILFFSKEELPQLQLSKQEKIYEYFPCLT